MNLKKISGIGLAVVAVLNLTLFLLRLESMTVFWGVVAVLAIFAWLILPKIK